MGMLSKYSLWGCLLGAAICLVAGYGTTGLWAVILVFLSASFLVFLLRRQMGSWFPTVMLVLYLLVACLGLMMEMVPAWMLVGVTAALGSWDLAQFRPRLESGGRPDLLSSLERRHVEYLSVSLGLGLLMAFAGLFLRLQLSFGLMVLIVLLVLGSLYWFNHLVNT